jgi:hypothetical protein
MSVLFQDWDGARSWSLLVFAEAGCETSQKLRRMFSKPVWPARISVQPRGGQAMERHRRVDEIKVGLGELRLRNVQML